MKERSFDEMIAYFNCRVADMDISQDCKMELLGMVTALGYKHEKSAQQWIPCSERLPEEGKDVLCCFYNGEHYRIIVSHITDFNFWSGVGRTGDLIAWMPLPEPWKGEQP